MALQMIEDREVVDAEVFTVFRLLQENSSLLQSINECHKSGRLQEAQRFQEHLQKNLIFLGNEVDPSLLAELQTENSQQSVPTSSSNPASVPSPSRPPPQQQQSMHTPQQQQQHQQQNGHLSPYGMNHGPSPQMRNGYPAQDPQMQQQMHNMYGMPPNSMPNGYYGQPPMQQQPYMNGNHPMQQPPPR